MYDFWVPAEKHAAWYGAHRSPSGQLERLHDLLAGMRVLLAPAAGLPRLPARWNSGEWGRDRIRDTLITWRGAIELLGLGARREPRPRAPFAVETCCELPTFLNERIERDLAPWRSGISRQALRWAGRDAASRRMTAPPATLFVEIEGGRPTFRIIVPHFFNRFVIAFVLRLSRRHALPTTSFFVNCSDWPIDSGNRETPIFSFVKTESYRDLLLPSPDIMSTLFAGPLIPQEVPWSEKSAVGFFRGGATGPPDAQMFRPRVKLLELADAHPDLFDVGLTGLPPGTHEAHRKGWVHPSTWSRYRYLIHVDGNTAAYRLANSMRTGSVIVKQESPYIEYWYGGLVADTHFVATGNRLEDLVLKLQELRGDDQWAQAVTEAAARFADLYLSRDAVFAYVVQLLKGYSALVR